MCANGGVYMDAWMNFNISRISIFNAHLTLFVRRMTSHNSIGKFRHLKSKLTWNGASPFADQTSRM